MDVVKQRRVFFAVRPGSSERDVVEDRLQNLEIDTQTAKRLRWLDPAGWHITLRFVGNVDAELVPDLSQCIAPIQPFTIHFQAIEPFPSARRPLVLAATGTAEEAGHALVANLEAQCRALDLPGETRRWRPHMSLARIRGRRHIACQAALDLSMQVHEILLMESVSRAGGNAYVPVSHGAA